MTLVQANIYQRATGSLLPLRTMTGCLLPMPGKRPMEIQVGGRTMCHEVWAADVQDHPVDLPSHIDYLDSRPPGAVLCGAPILVCHPSASHEGPGPCGGQTGVSQTPRAGKLHHQPSEVNLTQSRGQPAC